MPFLDWSHMNKTGEWIRICYKHPTNPRLSTVFIWILTKDTGLKEMKLTSFQSFVKTVVSEEIDINLNDQQVYTLCNQTMPNILNTLETYGRPVEY